MKLSNENPALRADLPYAGFSENLILRDHLAIDRTRLANERTLLSWLRTALMMLVSGITLLKLFEGVMPMETLGALLIPTSLWVGFLGARRYRLTRRSIQTALGE
jgi:putative membrane protein